MCLPSRRRLISMLEGVSSVFDCVWLVGEERHRHALSPVSLGVEPCAVCLKRVSCGAWVSEGMWGQMTITTPIVVDRPGCC